MQLDERLEGDGEEDDRRAVTADDIVQCGNAKLEGLDKDAARERERERGGVCVREK